jgi:hypothetical protein
MKPIAILATVVCLIGCAAPFSRPVPTESQYKERFLTHLRPEQIHDLRFSYHGAVGGEASIARFTVGADAISQILAIAKREDMHLSEGKDKADELKRKIAMCTREGRIPDWYDFPFDKSLPVFIDSGDYTDQHPAYSHEWYVDENRGIVYVVIIEG